MWRDNQLFEQGLVLHLFCASTDTALGGDEAEGRGRHKGRGGKDKLKNVADMTISFYKC